ncbi:MAG: outer membrane protein assembly factor BamA [Verrucomicrobiales bacterium]|nr:outer membrane protein assembly factor BamA [Verrucomicrobiales bacterium]
MNRHPSSRLRSTFHCLFSLIVGVFGWASQGVSQEEGQAVRQIDVQYIGSAAVSKERILSHVSTKVGDRVSQAKLDEDLKSLFKSGDVENASIFSEPVGGGVRLVFKVQTRSAMGNILFRGNSVLASTDLRGEVDLKSGDSIDEEALRKGRDGIQKKYTKRGYPETTVSYNVGAPNAQGFSDVTYTVSEGGRGVLRKVTFVGNKAFGAEELRKQMSQKEKGLLNIFSKKGQTDANSLESDIRAIENFYRDHGYLNARVLNASRVRADEKNVDLVITIDEGQPYHVGALKIEGIRVLSYDSEINPYLRTKAGSIYSGEALREDIRLIQDQYGVQGYADAVAVPRLDPSGGNQVDIVLQVSEGQRFKVREIHIEGNTKTLDEVIRRELSVSPGEDFNTAKVEAAQKRLMNMNYFSSVDVMPVEASYMNEKDLLIQVSEKPTGTINLGAGFSSIDNLVGFVELTQSNFDLWNRNGGFTGGGQRFRVSVRGGSQRKDAVISWTEPWFLDRPIALTVEAFYRDLNFLSDFYDQTQYGGSFGFRKSFTDSLWGRTEFRGQQVKIDADPNASESILAEDGSYLDTSISVEMAHDTRDSLFLPRSGHKLLAGVEQSFGDLDTNTLNLEAAQYVTLPADIIVSVYGEAKFVNNDTPIFKRAFLGGANDLRGFHYRDVGPKDETGEPLGGDESWFITAEATVPVIDKVRFAAFYDVGQVSGGPGTFGGGTNSDYGIGLRLFLLGPAPIKLDYAIPMQSDTFNDSSGRFNFTIGAQF